MSNIKSSHKILLSQCGDKIAYNYHEGRSPGIVFLSGLMSDMNGSKALALEEHCRKKERAFLRFDYTGHGQSSGDFEKGTITKWCSDAIFAIEKLTRGSQILIGSSMGGWIMFLVALHLKTKVAGLIGVAAAPDFTEDIIKHELNDKQRHTLKKSGSVEIPCDYDEQPFKITQNLIDDGYNNLMLNKAIPLKVPVRLIQGMRDSDVPWTTALRIQEKLDSNDVELTLVKGGDHRLSEPYNLKLLTGTLETLINKLKK